MEQAQPPHPSHFNGFHGPGTGYPPLRPDQLNAEGDDELIPTAIVIKNIPFAVKKETLVHVMQDLQVPLPYAFNYHFDNGVFRGLAFANFTTPEETSAVIHAMNHMELHGRKLRVEYKKMLPQAERDRIEREKRERRGQLEEQHRPMAAGGLQNQPSLSSLGSHVPATSPSPLSGGPGQARMRDLRSSVMRANIHLEVDFNDPAVLGYYRALAVFAEKGETDYITFPAEIPAEHRRVIHKLAHDQGLGHESLGQGPDRRIHIYRHPAGTYGISPTVAGNPYAANTGQRSLNRAATTDFTNVRSNEAGFYEAPTPSVSGWSASADPQSVLSASANLRNAKSFADLRSNAGSPAHSNPGSGLLPNMSRFQSYGSDSPNSSRTNLATTSAAFSNGPDSLLNGISSMSLNSTGYGPTAGSPQRLRGIQPWDREPTGGPGPIGGHRTQSGNHEEQSRNRGHGIPTRPLRGALSGGSAFPRRQNGHQKRGSDEISSPSGVEINITQ